MHPQIIPKNKKSRQFPHAIIYPKYLPHQRSRTKIERTIIPIKEVGVEKRKLEENA